MCSWLLYSRKDPLPPANHAVTTTEALGRSKAVREVRNFSDGNDEAVLKFSEHFFHHKYLAFL